MSSVNITITHDPLAADLYATDRAPYTVSGWFTDPASDVVVSHEVHGIDPVRLIGDLLRELGDQIDTFINMMEPGFEVETTVMDIDIDAEEYVK
jgi:hypothetical protein